MFESCRPLGCCPFCTSRLQRVFLPTPLAPTTATEGPLLQACPRASATWEQLTYSLLTASPGQDILPGCAKVKLFCAQQSFGFSSTQILPCHTAKVVSRRMPARADVYLCKQLRVCPPQWLTRPRNCLSLGIKATGYPVPGTGYPVPVRRNLLKSHSSYR